MGWGGRRQPSQLLGSVALVGRMLYFALFHCIPSTLFKTKVQVGSHLQDSGCPEPADGSWRTKAPELRKGGSLALL